MEKYYDGILIKSAIFKIIDIKDFKNGKGYELLSEEEYLSPSTDFTDRQYLYALNYSPLNNFLSNNYGANDNLKINKAITLYFISGDINHPGKNMIIKSENGEVFFMNDEIKEENEVLIYNSDRNLKYLKSIKKDIDIEELLSFIKNDYQLVLKQGRFGVWNLN